MLSPQLSNNPDVTAGVQGLLSHCHCNCSLLPPEGLGEGWLPGLPPSQRGSPHLDSSEHKIQGCQRGMSE